MAILDDLGAALESAGVGTLGTSLFLGEMPETAVMPVLALLEYPGEMGERTFGGPVTETPRVQILGRGATYPEVRAKVQDAYKALDGVYASSGTPALYIQALQPPFRIGTDAQDRVLVACNIRAVRKHP